MSLPPPSAFSLGVLHHELFSAAATVLDEALGLEHGVTTTIHSAMNDQPVIDAYHQTDLRLTRSAMQSIVPVDTGWQWVSAA